MENTSGAIKLPVQNYRNLLKMSKQLIFLEPMGLPIDIRPNLIFSYENAHMQSVGGIWFITWLEGFNSGNLGIYTEALYRYLTSYYDKYTINS